MSEQKTTDMSQHFYRAAAADFMKIPGSPIAYWVSTRERNLYQSKELLENYFQPRKGLDTGENDLFLRLWFEVSNNKSNLYNKNQDSKWYPYNKGGEFRRWYGNRDYLINWEDNGEAIKSRLTWTKKKPTIRNASYYFKEGMSWTTVSSGGFSARYSPPGALFDNGGCTLFSETELDIAGSFINSSTASRYLEFLSPTLNFQPGNIAKILLKKDILDKETNFKLLVKISKQDYDSYEYSWCFSSLTLLTRDIQNQKLSKNYANLRALWLADTQEMQRLEEENNRIFIDAYGLQDELTPEVPLKEITLTCNPHYRYGGDLTEQEREDRLQSDTIAELLSYAIGCMMGRYSLDREGLVYAHAGNEGFADLVAEGAYKTFAADDDGILPLTEQEWFSDDVTNRISEFVHTVWGEQHLEENLQFIADSLCLYALKAKKGERALDTIRRYLSNQFYKDHLKTYKRRPIYWLFSSGKHKAFECLVYLHRYHEGTLARMRAEYVIPLTARINARINRLQEEAEAASSTSERKQLMAELKTLQNQQAELATFDEQLRHHADQRISLDLDDGVKENYGKFGNLLDSVKAVTGKNND